MRELQCVIELAVILARSPVVDIEPQFLATLTEPEDPSPSLTGMERRHIVRVLEGTHWRIYGPQGAGIPAWHESQYLTEQAEKARAHPSYKSSTTHVIQVSCAIALDRDLSRPTALMGLLLHTLHLFFHDRDGRRFVN